MSFIEGITAMSSMDKAAITGNQELIAPTANNNIFLNVINQIDTEVKAAESIMTEYALGNSEIEVHELMVSLETAKMSLQTSVEIRNKLVESYKEITSMQV